MTKGSVKVVKFQPFQRRNCRLNEFKKVHVYFKETIVIGARSLNAPSLNFSID